MPVVAVVLAAVSGIFFLWDIDDTLKLQGESLESIEEQVESIKGQVKSLESIEEQVESIKGQVNSLAASHKEHLDRHENSESDHDPAGPTVAVVEHLEEKEDDAM